MAEKCKCGGTLIEIELLRLDGPPRTALKCRACGKFDRFKEEIKDANS